jgi:cytochrome P450
VRKEIPGTKYNKGKKGERHLAEFFKSEIPKRRNSDLADMFTFMCKEKDDQGNYFPDEDIIGHAAFLLFAAHDTTTSVLNHIIMYTSQHPEWQTKMRDECVALGKDNIEYEDLEKMVMVDRVFHESLRLRPSVPLMTRRTINECEIDGVRVPANTMVFVPNISHHRDPKYWTNPEAFDPDRFSPERAEHKNHSFCYTPFGGGAHKCIGLHFAAMLSKTMMHKVLTKMEYSLPVGFEPKAEWFPLPKPKKLPVYFNPLK